MSGRECVLWWARVTDVRADYVGLLSPPERARLPAFARSADRDRFVLGRAVLRVVVAGRLGGNAVDVPLRCVCSHCGGDHGPPAVEGAALGISISHAGAWVVVAVATGATIGVDIEPVSSRPAAGMEAHAGMLSPTELTRPLPAPDEVATIWTRKESVLKATRDGLLVDPRTLTVSSPTEPAELLDWADRPELVGRVTMVERCPDDRYAACLSVIDGADVAVSSRDAGECLSGLQ